MHELYLENANLRHARHLIATWRDDYNHHRPHSSLDGLTPQEYHQRSTEDQTLNRPTSNRGPFKGAGHQHTLSLPGTDWIRSVLALTMP